VLPATSAGIPIKSIRRGRVNTVDSLFDYLLEGGVEFL